MIGALFVAPFSAAHARDTGLIFASFGADGVAVIDPKTGDAKTGDPKTGATIKHLKTSRGPRELHFNADHTRLYVACTDDDVIDVVDVATLEVAGRFNTLSKPETFAIDEKRRRLYVGHHDSAAVAVIDMDENVIVDEIATDAGTGSIFVGKGGQFVYVASVVGDVVDRIDAGRGHIVDSVPVGTKPHRLAATADGRVLLVSSELSGEIQFIDIADFAVTGRLRFALPGAGPMTAGDMVLTRDGTIAYVALGLPGRVAAVDVSTRRIKDYIPAGERPGNIGLSHDRKTLYVAGASRADITAIDVTSHEVTASIPVGPRLWTFVIDD